MAQSAAGSTAPGQTSRRTLLLLACIACCAPLLLLAIPPVIGLLATVPAGLFTSAWATGFGANTIVGALAGILTWAWRRRRASEVDTRATDG